ncbi:hypothetical protein DFP72DRAFT_858368 [Ephemerocybe angulata]|uniref:Uncharacterized protein n=1 Tax=Ephemerocybe angulata TaxID=980116 RepID=A0A8H6HDF5_9AGAR|nr:hypothetical protein DFP72DRAFT_858368 [Tulosesus angulatus]
MAEEARIWRLVSLAGREKNSRKPCLKLHLEKALGEEIVGEKGGATGQASSEDEDEGLEESRTARREGEGLASWLEPGASAGKARRSLAPISVITSGHRMLMATTAGLVAWISATMSSSTSDDVNGFHSRSSVPGLLARSFVTIWLTLPLGCGEGTDGTRQFRARPLLRIGKNVSLSPLFPSSNSLSYRGNIYETTAAANANDHDIWLGIVISGLGNPDIAMVGVRIAIYIENLLCFIPAFWALVDGKVAHGELEAATRQRRTSFSLSQPSSHLLFEPRMQARPTITRPFPGCLGGQEEKRNRAIFRDNMF